MPGPGHKCDNKLLSHLRRLRLFRILKRVDTRPLSVRTVSMALKRSSPRTPKTRKSPRPKRTPATVPDVVPERADDEEEEDDQSADVDSFDETPHAGVLALAKIREALQGLSQEDLQLLVKGTSVSRPLQADDKAAASAALDLAVRAHLYDVLDNSTRKLYQSIASDPSNVEDGVWARIFSGIRPSAPELLPDISVHAHNPLLDWRPKKVTPDTHAAFRTRTKEATTDDVLLRFRISLCPSSCDS